MKTRPIIMSGPSVRAILDGRKTQTRRVPKKLYNGTWCLAPDECPEDRRTLQESCPYGKAGDQLWVRETWMDLERHLRARAGGDWTAHQPGRWRPAMLMPRWASRITLVITGVHVERLQDITEEDAQAEGVEPAYWTVNTEGYDKPTKLDYRAGFACHWDSLNAKRGFSFTVNPWVWTLSFERQEPVA